MLDIEEELLPLLEGSATVLDGEAGDPGDPVPGIAGLTAPMPALVAATGARLSSARSISSRCACATACR